VVDCNRLLAPLVAASLPVLNRAVVLGRSPQCVPALVVLSIVADIYMHVVSLNEPPPELLPLALNFLTVFFSRHPPEQQPQFSSARALYVALSNL